MWLKYSGTILKWFKNTKHIDNGTQRTNIGEWLKSDDKTIDNINILDKRCEKISIKGKQGKEGISWYLPIYWLCNKI